jgi:hypothetical protein
LGWFAVSPLRPVRTRPPTEAEIGEALARATHLSPVLTTGTLMTELYTTLPDRETVLLRIGSPGFDMTIRHLPGATILLTLDTADGGREARVDIARLSRTPILRISVTWDAATTLARLWVEAPDFDAAPLWCDIPGPFRPPRDALCLAVLSPVAGHWGEEVNHLAVSDRLHAVGPRPALAANALIETPHGLVRTDRIRPGDTVLARNAEGRRVPTEVRATIRARLPARGAFRPVLLHAPYFGLTADTFVAANKKVVIGGSEVEYLYARERVLVPARHLVSPTTGRFVDSADTAIWHQLLLPEQEQLTVAGCEIESLNVGSLRRAPEAHAASLLSAIPRRALPHHAASAFPVLRDYEAAALLAQMSR